MTANESDVAQFRKVAADLGISAEATERLFNPPPRAEGVSEIGELAEVRGAAERNPIESGYLIGFKSADTLRNRAATATQGLSVGS